MINPVTLPVRWGKDDLAFGFNFDASNPPFADYLVRFYDADGKALGEHAYHKDFVGAVLIEDVVRQWNGADTAKVATALVAPDHLKIGLAPQRLVTTADMLVRHLKTGDQDYTEFQNSWRNLGAIVPTLPHWLHPSIGVIGRTNIMGRVRTKGGYRTAVYVANASGNLAYDMPAEVEISAINNAGRRLSYYLTLPAFGGAGRVARRRAAGSRATCRRQRHCRSAGEIRGCGSQRSRDRRFATGRRGRTASLGILIAPWPLRSKNSRRRAALVSLRVWPGLGNPAWNSIGARRLLDERLKVAIDPGRVLRKVDAEATPPAARRLSGLRARCSADHRRSRRFTPTATWRISLDTGPIGGRLDSDSGCWPAWLPGGRPSFEGYSSPTRPRSRPITGAI